MYNFKLKLRTNKNYEKRTAHWYNVTSLLLKPLKLRLIIVISFRLSKFLYSLSFPFRRTNSFGSVFPDHLGRHNLEVQIPDTRQLSSFHFLFLLSPLLFRRCSKPSFCSSLQLCCHSTSLPIYCQSRKIRATLRT